MDFLTKSGIRDKVEEFLEGIPNNSRIPFSKDMEDSFIHIGEPIDRLLSKYQTFLNLEDEQTEHDKDIRQGNFSLSGR